MPVCIDGPLRNEDHDFGDTFEFDGRPIGREVGIYRLIDGEYHWHPARDDLQDRQPDQAS